MDQEGEASDFRFEIVFEIVEHFSPSLTSISARIGAVGEGPMAHSAYRRSSRDTTGVLSLPST